MRSVSLPSTTPSTAARSPRPSHGIARCNGGWLTVEDLAGFEAEIEPAVVQRFRDWSVWTPTTWCQGPALLQALGVISHAPLDALAHNSGAYIHLLTEVLQLVLRDRERYYGDPRLVDVPIEWLSARALTRALQRDRPGALEPAGDGGCRGRSQAPGHPLSVHDRRRRQRLLGATSSTLDGAPIVPELGLLVSPRGLQSRLDAEHPRRSWPASGPA